MTAPLDGPGQALPPGWHAPTHAHRFVVAAPRERVWDWLNDPATFTDTQVGPFRVEFLANGTAGGFTPGVLTTHHGPLLHLPGVIGEVREGEYRDLRYLYGAFAVSFRLLRPTRLQFDLADAPGGATTVEIRIDAHVHPRARRLWDRSQRLFWRRFETWARRSTAATSS